MVRTEEERDKRIGMAREGSSAMVVVGASSPSKVGSMEDVVYNNEAMRVREKLDRMEKEIVRITMIAEKDKRDSIACTNRIKKIKEQLVQLSDNSQGDDEIRRCHSESDLLAQFPEYGCSVSPPPSSLPTFRGLASSSAFRLDAENKSPNISPASSPVADDCKLLRNWESMVAQKEDELARVKLRAKEEAARAASLRHEEEEMKKLLARETEIRVRANEDIKAAIARKEKEIQRLSMLAERDKRTGMFMRDKIAHQKRTLASFANSTARPDRKPDFMRILHSCDEMEPTPISPASVASSSYGSSAGASMSPLSLTPTSPSGPFLCRSSSSSSSGGGCASPLRAETDILLRAEACKEEELSRVSAIAGAEACRVSFLKDKSNEIEKVITTELQEANERLEFKIKQIRMQQDAIHKVLARAEMERAKACALHEELNNLQAKCSEKQGAPINIKKSEFQPDKAYLAEFKELSELVPVSDINTPKDPVAAPSKDNVHIHAHSLPHTPSAACGCVDPLTYIQSPPCKQISFSDSQMVYAQKLQDLVALDRVSVRLEEELVCVKRLKEAELARRMLLAEKLRELKEDSDVMRLLGQG